jgi:hypothetical protein
VSGAAAAITNNSTGVAGAAWNASILPVKVLDSFGSGTDANIASGIAWAVNHGANIINLSLGGSADNPVLKSAVLNAITAGVVVVAAAGNNGANTPFYPAAYDGVIAVGATTATGDMAWFSNHGPWVDLAAPGVNDVMPCATTVFWCTTGYVVDSGTSFSAPLVSGIIVLVKSQHPTWTPAQILAWLGNTATDRGPAGTDDYYGRGLIDAWAAVSGPGQNRSQPTGDALEPNDVPERATTIALGSSQSGSISPQGDVDWYQATAGAEGSITFTVTPPAASADLGVPEMDPVLVAYDSTFHQVAYADNGGNGASESLSIGGAAGQQFFLKVSNFVASVSGGYTVAAAVPVGPLSAPLRYALRSPAQGIGYGDFNGDGRPDVGVTTDADSKPATDNKLFVFAQQSRSGLANTQVLAADLFPNGGSNVSGGDLNGDGKTDLVMGMPFGYDTFLQSGGGLQDKTNVGTPTSTYMAKAADADGDGKADVFALTSNGLTLMRNTAGGWVAVELGPSGPGMDFAIGDINADGRKDVAIAGSSGLELYMQQVDHSFVHSHTDSALPGALSGAIGIGDVNGDGRLDVVLHRSTSNAGLLEVFLQQVDHTLAAATTFASSGRKFMVVGDVNGDGLADAVMTPSSGAGTVRYGSASTVLGIERPYALPGTYVNSPGAFALADVTGDGAADLLAADNTRGTVGGFFVLRGVPAISAAGEQLWVRNTGPADFSFGLATTAAPSVTFARALNPASVTSSTVQLVDGSTGKVVQTAVAYNADTVTLTPSRPLEFQHPYQVRVGAVQDQLANTFTEGYSYRFTTIGAPTYGFPSLRFYQREVNAPGPADSNFAFGSPDCTAVSGDWNGDGIDTPGVYCGGTWYLRNSNTPGPPDIAFAYGTTGYVPVVGDWNGDGTDGIGVYVDGTWYLRETASPGAPQIAFAYGTADYTPVVGNWDGNATGTKGADGIGVYINGSWYLRDTPSAGSPQRAFAYGTVGYKPVTGKFGGTLVDGVGIVTGPTWHLRNTPTAGPPDVSLSFGDQAYQTITGDWDGDGTDTIAVGVPT